MVFVPDTQRADGSYGTQLAALSDHLVKLHKETCGRGPTNARCFASGNTVVCLLFGGLTGAERQLLASGDPQAVAAHRSALHAIMRPRAIELAEEQLGRRVTALTLAADPANELETAVFVLDAPPDF